MIFFMHWFFGFEEQFYFSIRKRVVLSEYLFKVISTSSVI